MAGSTFCLCLVGIMDHLWFNQVIFFSEPINSLVSNPKILDVVTHDHPCSDNVVDSTDISEEVLSEDHLLEQQNCLSSGSSSSDMLMDDSDSGNKIKEQKDRPTRVNLASRRARSRSQSSSSRLARDRPKKGPSRLKTLPKCRSFEDLEMEEVKGLMDLGFIFRKEHLSPRMMSLVPGLQRLNLLYNKKQQQEEEMSEENDDDEEQEEIRCIMRPYLSESWLIRRSNSPLLNLRGAPKAFAAAEMKQHLRSWARSVAAVIEQQS